MLARRHRRGMVGTATLTILLVIATVVDVRSRRIPNWLTYTGTVLGLLLSGLASGFSIDRDAGESVWAVRLGLVAWQDSLIGCLACGGIMLAGYVLFPGAIGGGDLKLLAMMGAFLGLHSGLEALLWTMVLSGCLAVIVLIWHVGAWTLLAALGRAIWSLVRGRWPDRATWPVMQTDLYLSPSALAAALLVRANESMGWW